VCDKAVGIVGVCIDLESLSPIVRIWLLSMINGTNLWDDGVFYPSAF
jgi:hypothetical protein